MNWKATAYSSKQQVGRTRGYVPPASDTERILVRHVVDLCRAAQYGRGVRTTGFLSDREQELARMGLSKFEGTARFWGGFSRAERQVLAVCGEGEPLKEDYGITCLKIVPAGAAGMLTHRDYLGALLGLGLEREAVGDIVTDGEKGALVYVKGVAARLIQNELTSVGRCTVKVEPAGVQDVPAPAQMQQLRSTVSSMRLDAVLAAVLRTGRNKAAQLVRAGAVSVNHVETTSVHYELFEGDVLRVRGYGKYRLCQAGAQSKKGRVIISYCQY